MTPDLLERLPNHHLVLIGDGRLKSDWDSLKAASRHSSRIHLLGRRTDVRDWMNESELLLLPARYEGMPNVVLEAIAAGLPVCVTRVEGVTELLGDKLADQSVERNAWGEWLELVIKLANNFELRKSLGTANRDRCQREFRIEKCMAQYEQLFLTVSKFATSHTVN